MAGRRRRGVHLRGRARRTTRAPATGWRSPTAPTPSRPRCAACDIGRGRRGDRARAHVRRLGDRGAGRQRHARPGRHRPGHAVPRPRGGRGRDHAADAGDRGRARGRCGRRPRRHRRPVRPAGPSAHRGLRPRPRDDVAGTGRRFVGRRGLLLDAAQQADDRRRGRRAGVQRRASAGPGMELRRLRPGGGRVVLPPRPLRLEPPHDGVAGRRPPGAARPLPGPAPPPRRERGRARPGHRGGARPATAAARPEDGRRRSVLLRRPLRRRASSRGCPCARWRPRWPRRASR